MSRYPAISRFDQGKPCCDVYPFIFMLSLELLCRYRRYRRYRIPVVDPFPADHVLDWQPRIFQGVPDMVEVRLVA